MEEGCVSHYSFISSLLDIKKGTRCVHDYKGISIKKVNYTGGLNQGVGEGGLIPGLKHQSFHWLAI